MQDQDGQNNNIYIYYLIYYEPVSENLNLKIVKSFIVIKMKYANSKKSLYYDNQEKKNCLHKNL